MTKYIFISGGVISGVGKGTITASLSALLKNHGYKVSPIKIDMYLNYDAGTIRPQEHGEVFVLSDGLECDQDLGNYERFLDAKLTRDNYLTAGQVYYNVISRERAFGYEGEDVETIPHLTNEIIERIENAGKKRKADIVLIELGGTVGEYQNGVFFEASRIMKQKNPQDVCHLHVVYLITPKSLGEMKTKPAQQSVQLLNSLGIQPDFVVTRSENELDEPRRKKLAMFCGVPENHVIASPDIDSIYRVPEVLSKQKLDTLVLKKLKLKSKKESDIHDNWKKITTNITLSDQNKPINIGLVGKYFKIGSFSLSDVYISVLESLKHAGWHHRHQVNIRWIDGEKIESGDIDDLKNIDGIIVPGGFGARGIEGILQAIKYARENNIPYFGLCYGMQLACIEFARNICKLKNANTTEIDSKSKNPIIHLMPEQIKKLSAQLYGGSMRLGSYESIIDKKSKLYHYYQKDKIIERHRHRYEFNNDYRQLLSDQGMVFSALSPDKQLVEAIELPDHPFFVAVQYHPEFLSTPHRPHPLFLGFIKACLDRQKE